MIHDQGNVNGKPTFISNAPINIKTFLINANITLKNNADKSIKEGKVSIAPHDVFNDANIQFSRVYKNTLFIRKSSWIKHDGKVYLLVIKQK